MQRAASDGVGRIWPASGKRGHQEPHSSTYLDQQQHCGIPADATAFRIQLRLAAGNFYMRTGILPLEPMVFSAHARKGAGVSQESARELVSEVLHRAGERASN